jgi:single-stranded DNA-binding protein
MSHVTIVGTIASEPRPFTTESGKKKLEIRVLDGGLHHTVIAWERAADITLAIGDAVLCADGRIGYRSYEKDGTKVWVTEFTVQNIQKLGSITAPSKVEPDNGSADDLGF